MFNLVVGLVLVGAIVSGCATVDVIAPVAQQNQRNATALNQNLAILLEADELLFRAVFEAEAVDTVQRAYRMIVENEITSAVRNMQFTALVAHFNREAQKLQDITKDLAKEAREIQIRHLHEVSPLASEIAFRKQLAEVVVSKVQAIIALRDSPSVTPDQRFDKVGSVIADLYFVQSRKQAAIDLLDAYKRRKAVILQQSANGKLIADQLVSATTATTEPGKFLKGVVENGEVLQGLAQYVASSTNDPDRKRAAEDLLKKIGETK
jgi:hypothetical protein